MDNLNRFNDQLYDFFSQLNYLYPKDQDISSFKKKIYMGKIVNTRGLYQEFNENVMPHKEYILNRNENELLKVDNMFINKIKEYYICETVCNKKAILDYLNVLVLLSEKINLRI